MELIVEGNRMEKAVKLLLRKRVNEGVISYQQFNGVVVSTLFKEVPDLDKALPFLEMDEEVFGEFLEAMILFSARHERALLDRVVREADLLQFTPNHLKLGVTDSKHL